jgi:hypothetical protein
VKKSESKNPHSKDKFKNQKTENKDMPKGRKGRGKRKKESLWDIHW